MLMLSVTIFLFPLFAQENYEKETSPASQKCKDLILQLNTILVFGNEYAKSQGLTAADYGRFAAQQYIDQGWLKEGSFEDLTNACLYNLSCFQSDKGIEVIAKTHDNIKIKSCPFLGFIKKDEPCFIITLQEYFDYFNAAMATFSKHVGCNYDVLLEEGVVYIRFQEIEL